MAKTLTIRIKAFETVLEDFRDTFKKLQAGEKVESKEGLYFTSLEAAHNLLTPHRLHLLHAIREKRPQSMDQLTTLLGRHPKDVQEDLQILAQYGLVRLVERKDAGQRRVKMPRVPYEGISLQITI